MLATSAACVDTDTARAQPASQAERALVPDKPFPPVARKLLDARMLRHGEDMEILLWACLSLDYEAIRITAARLAKEPRLSRPSDGPLNPLTAILPDKFFDHQDAFYEHAGALFRAARAKDDEAIAASYGQLATTCVGCHALYLRIDPTPDDEAPGS